MGSGTCSTTTSSTRGGRRLPIAACRAGTAPWCAQPASAARRRTRPTWPATRPTRVREWDSCFSLDHSYIHGGSVRSSGRRRYRQWMTHKLAGWIDQFGTSGCVGCGRCITWCPVAIDITEEAAAIRATSHATIEDLLAENAALRQARARASRADRGLRPQPHVRRPASTCCARAIRPTLLRPPSGDVALETYAPQRGAVTIETVHDGDLLGWSWLVPPYRTVFDARALGTVHAIAFDGACLRGKCDGRSRARATTLLQLFTEVIVERLQNTRLRLLDVYGTGHGEPSAVPPSANRLRCTRRPSGWRTVARRPTTRGRSSSCVPAGTGDAVARFAPGQFAMLYAFGVGEVPISVSDHTAGGRAARSTPSVPSAPSPPRCASCAPGDAVGVRGPFGTAWPLEEAEGRDVVVVAGGIGLAPLRPAIYHVLAHRERYGGVAIALRRALARRAALSPPSSSAGAARFDVEVARHGRRGAGRLARAGRRRHDAPAARRLRSRPHGGDDLSGPR